MEATERLIDHKDRKTLKFHLAGSDEALGRFWKACHHYQNTSCGGRPVVIGSWTDGRFIAVEEMMVELCRDFVIAAGLTMESIDGKHGHIRQIIMACERGYPILNKLRELEEITREKGVIAGTRKHEIYNLLNDLGWCLDDARGNAIELEKEGNDKNAKTD
jgi:hypothetical protein